ncbi:ATP-binding protein [Parabacteroides johnsonii]|uniref:hypothetical protein n=1 Tax=Parabacteroides johnsonii TaxID=387661 RepID=UPI0024314FCC|nr:hypothetical protein [Parabacteroides johnsonii]
MADRGITYDILLRMRDQVSGVSKTIDKELKVVKQSADQVVGSLNGISGRLSAVSNASVGNVKNISNVVDNLKRQYQSLGKEAATASEALENSTKRVTPRFNSLNVSVQQVARELPALAISANTFFLAISNNLPILADSISAVRKENQELIASGQKAVPVWKQVAGSLFSWQTALVAGVTILSMYGEEIFNVAGEMSGLSKVTKTQIDRQKELNDSQQKGAQNAQEELTKLKLLYQASQDITRPMAERKRAVDELKKSYPKYLGNLTEEEILTGKAATQYKNLTNAIVSSAKARAAQDKIVEYAKKEIENEALLTELYAKREQMVSRLTKEQQLLTDLSRTGEAQEFQVGIVSVVQGKVDAIDKDIARLKNENEDILKLQKDLAKGIKVEDITFDSSENDKNTNKNLATIGGLINKINELKEVQLKASEEQAIALEKEIRLYEERLNLVNKTIIAGAEGNLSKGSTELLKAPNIQAMDVPAIEFPLKIDEKSYQRVQQKIRESGYVFVKEAQITARQMSGILSNSIQGFMEGFGEAVASGNGLEILRSFLLSLMDMLQQFGSALIAAGMASEALKAIAWSGIGGIIAGSALIAATAAAKAALQNITAFAAGGIVSGPTLALVGEYSGASNNPEVIAPLNKLRSMLEPTGLSAKSLYLETKVKGKDLYIALRGVEHEKRRTR